MKKTALLLAMGVLLVSQTGVTGDVKSARRGLAPFNMLIGEWKGTGSPKATAGDRDRRFWIEHIEWEWKFGKDDACLVVRFEKSPSFQEGRLHYLPESKTYRLVIKKASGETATYEGSLVRKRLRMLRTDGPMKNRELLTIRLLHSNRITYSLAVVPKGRASFQEQFLVGATKKGVPFAAGTGLPECIVTGGLGKIKVSYKGRTYYVCCGGCRDAFYESPEEYIREYEAKKKGRKK